MADWMLGVGQMLAVVVIVGGVTVALFQVWVLANKLARNLDREGIVPPADPAMHADRMSPGKRPRHR